MEMVLRAAAIYLILLIIFKIAKQKNPDAINQL